MISEKELNSYRLTSMEVAAQDLRCGFGKLEVIDFFVRYI